MKLSKTGWLFLAIGISIIAFASLSMAYSQQGQAKSQLDQELALARLRLDRYSLEEFSSQKQELESQLAGIEAKLKTVKAKLNRSIESIRVTDTLFKTAKAYHVEIIEVSSSSQTKDQLEAIPCSALSFMVKVEGNTADIINYTIELSREFPTSMAQSVQVKIPEVIEAEEETEEAEEEETEKSSAAIYVIIYSYQGD
jgi:hypothetical protein